MSDGQEAVLKAQELKPDLYFVDVGLPTLNGIEAAKRIRELAPESKIIFLTQESSPEVVQLALDLGAWGLRSENDGWKRPVSRRGRGSRRPEVCQRFLIQPQIHRNLCLVSQTLLPPTLAILTGSTTGFDRYPDLLHQVALRR